MTQNNQMPDGYMQDRAGRLVPLELVKPRDLICNDLVLQLAAEAADLNKRLREFKERAHVEIAAFVELSAGEYGVTLGGSKGNVTLYSYDGSLKIQRAYQESVRFDERLLAAKELIDGCIKRWSNGANQNIQKLVEHAFQTDREGHVSTSRVLGLRRLGIDDPDWRTAMDAISDAMQVVDSKSYVRLYQRVGNADAWQAISLNVSEV